MYKPFVLAGLLLALALPASAQVMKGPAKVPGSEKSKFFELFSVPVDPQIADDEALLKARGFDAAGPALLKYLAAYTCTDQERARLTPLLAQLNDKSFKVRESALKEMTQAGPAALTLLRDLARSKDLETVRRAEKCITIIEDRYDNEVLAAAVRLLRERRPAGTEAALMQFLAVAPTEGVEDEVAGTLLALAIANKAIDPAVAAALKDAHAGRRAAAALVLGHQGTPQQHDQVRKLLTDADPTVRFRAAQGLLCARDKAGAPVLVALLKDGPYRLAELSESLLQYLADKTAPEVMLAKSVAGRGKSHAAWDKWWQDKGGAVDVSKLDTDLFFADVPLRTREVAFRFFNSVFEGDYPKFQKATDVPFNFINQATFTTREEFEAFFKPLIESMKERMQKQKITAKVNRVITVGEYLKSAPAAEQQYVGKMPAAQTRIALMSIRPDGEGPGGPEQFAVVVRVVGVRARVIGLAQPSR